MAPPLRVQGWDPILLTSQIILLQALHYLTLALLLPPLLSLLTNHDYLEYLGGPATVGMILDWRELAGARHVGIAEWGEWGRHVGGKGVMDEQWEGLRDPRRSWVLGFAWILTSLIDILYLYHLIRRPTHILDFSITLLFIHLILTSYYSAAIPLSLFFWLIIFVGGAIMVIFAEQLCVRRELRDGIGTSSELPATAEEDEHADRIEMGGINID